MVRGVLKTEISERGWAASVFDPMAAFDSAAAISSSGLSIWGPDDGVHLTETAYKDILDGLQGHMREPCMSGEAGRRRLTSIVPATATSSPAPPPLRTPAWISGEASQVRGRGGWRGRNMGGRGGRSGRRGRWIGWPY